MARDENGVEIDGEWFPFDIGGFKIGDAQLVFELTGLEYEEFANLVDQGGTSRAMVGVIAVAVKRKTGWNRQRIIEYVENVDFDKIEIKTAEKDPPPVAAAENEAATSNGSTVTSDDAPAASPSSAPSTRASTGAQASATGSTSDQLT